jgi:hypothetical protein
VKRFASTLSIAALLLFAHAAQAGEPAARSGLAATWPANDLERLLVAANYDETQRPEFLRAFLHGEVCALTDKPVPAGANPDDHVALLAVKAPDGEMASPLFTAKQRATETFGEDVLVVCGNGAKLLDALRGGRVVLDPGQPFGILWTPTDIEHVLGTPRLVSPSTPVEYSAPDEKPEALIARLNDTFRTLPEIKAVWLARAYWPEQKEWSWFLEVHTTMDETKLNELLRDTASGIDMGGEPMDIAVLPPDAPPGKGIRIFER